jgi:hypothetical protein
MTRTAIPYNVTFAYLSLYFNTAPTIGDLEAPPVVYAHAENYLNVTINDADGVADFKNASLELNGTIVLGWDNATNTFSEVSDPNNYCVLNSSASLRITVNATAYKLCWKVKFEWNYTDGSIYALSTNTKVYDSQEAEGTVSDTFLFSYESDLIIYSATVDNWFAQPSQSLTVNGQLYYNGTATSPEDPNGIIVKIELNGNLKANSTTIDATGHFIIPFTAETTYGNFTYNIYATTDVNTLQNKTVWVLVSPFMYFEDYQLNSQLQSQNKPYILSSTHPISALSYTPIQITFTVVAPQQTAITEVFSYTMPISVSIDNYIYTPLSSKEAFDALTGNGWYSSDNILYIKSYGSTIQITWSGYYPPNELPPVTPPSRGTLDLKVTAPQTVCSLIYNSFKAEIHVFNPISSSYDIHVTWQLLDPENNIVSHGSLTFLLSGHENKTETIQVPFPRFSEGIYTLIVETQEPTAIKASTSIKLTQSFLIFGNTLQTILVGLAIALLIFYVYKKTR